MGSLKVGWIGMLCMFLFNGVAGAQVNTGTISGTVRDSSGGVLPGVNVVVLNQDTGTSRMLKTDENGHYSALSLSLGSYRVTGTRDGFATEVRTGIVLTVGQEEVVDLSLSLGATTQTVEVSGGAPLVETTTAALGSLVDDRTIRALPLNGRSWDQLAELQPGVVLSAPYPPPGTVFNSGTASRFSVGGQRNGTNLFLLDGMDINDQANGTPGGAAGTNLGVDTILEFKIFTNSFKAEYGHSMGSVVSAVSRSGTNSLHGTAFEYIRNHVLDASNFFDVGHSTPPFIRNQFGGVLGGPIKKDKLFFFAGYEGLRQGLATTQIATVPTELARQGILPTGTVAVSPAVVPYLNLYPLPNGRDFGNGAAQFLSAPTVITNEDNVMARVDYQLNPKTGTFGRYTYDNDSVPTPQSLPFELSTNASRRQYATVQANTVFSAKALNNLRFGFQRTADATVFEYTSPIPADLSFVPGKPLGTIQLGSIGAGTSNSQALTAIGGNNGNGPSLWRFNIFQTGDDFTYIIGKHTFKTGVDIERLQDNSQTNSGLRGVYTFASFNTFLAGTPSNLQASQPLGQPFSLDYRQTLFAVYDQDDYKVNSRLTLNLGLRWEVTTDPHDEGGKTALLPTLASTSTVISSSFFQISKKNFEPRIGLAWQLDGSGKTVFRAGFGIYHNQVLPWFYQVQTKVPPFGALFNAVNPLFPDGASQLGPASKVGLIVAAPTQKVPADVQYNLSLQQQIFKNTMVQVAYAGNRASHLATEIEGDTPIPTICSTGLGNCPAGVPDGAPYYPAGAPRRNTAWNGIRYYQTNGQSEYDSVTVTLRHQTSSGFEGQVFYTFSKALDDSSNNSPGDSNRSPQSVLFPPDGIKSDWAVSDFNIKHALVGYFSYPLPFRVDSKGLGAVVNGWKIDSIGTLTSGQPFTALLSTSVSRNQSTAGISERPNLNPGFSNNPTKGVSAGCPGFAAGTPVGTANNWYDPCAFSLPIAGTYGDLGRNTIIGPGIFAVNLALEKNFPITERLSTTFRAEAFNITNHTNLGLPNQSALVASGAANPAAGSVIYTTTTSRQLQFALRINF